MITFKEIYMNEEPSTSSVTLADGYHKSKGGLTVRGGIGDKFDLTKIDKKEFDLGIKTEMEHIKHNKDVSEKDKYNFALDIAKDHWKENLNYYKLLTKYVE